MGKFENSLFNLSVFKPLTGYWGGIHFRRLKIKHSRLSKAQFATHLCDPDVWGKAFSSIGIKNSFRYYMEFSQLIRKNTLKIVSMRT